jgi:acyl-coenzyme A thioesterase PaaI-like protein
MTNFISNLKQTLYLRAFGLLKVPLIHYVRPTVVRLNDEEAVVKIPLGYRTRNHLKSMYFGTLAVGADCAGGLLAFHLIRKGRAKISIVFKSFRADFHKRPTGDVHFTCRDGGKIIKQIRETLKTGKRTNHPIHIVATTPKVSGSEPVATFELVLSMKSA